MEILTAVIPDNCNIHMNGDDHYGARLCHETGIDKMVDAVASDPDARLIKMGDPIEAIMVDDKRFYLEASKESIPVNQARQIAEKHRPVTDKLIAWLMGNHDLKLWKVGNFVRDEILHELGMEHIYGGYTAKVLFLDKRGKPLFKFFLTHGRKSITSCVDDPLHREAYMKRVLKRHLYAKAGDCILMAKGHTHKCLIRDPQPALYLTDDTQDIRQHYTASTEQMKEYIYPDDRWYLNTGTFLKTYGVGVMGYGEAAEYDPIELAYPVVKVRDQKVVGVEKVLI